MFKFFKSAFLELKKVTWPKREEVFKNTKQVFIMIFFVGLYLAFVDYVMYLFISYIF